MYIVYIDTCMYMYKVRIYIVYSIVHNSAILRKEFQKYSKNILENSVFVEPIWIYLYSLKGTRLTRSRSLEDLKSIFFTIISTEFHRDNMHTSAFLLSSNRGPCSE